MRVGQASINERTIGCKLQCDSSGCHIMRKGSWEESVFRKVFALIHKLNFLIQL